MVKTITVTELRRNIIYNFLDEVLKTGVPIEINKGEKVKIVPADMTDKLQNLISRPNVIKGDPDDLVDIDWGKRGESWFTLTHM